MTYWKELYKYVTHGWVISDQIDKVNTDAKVSDFFDNEKIGNCTILKFISDRILFNKLKTFLFMLMTLTRRFIENLLLQVLSLWNLLFGLIMRTSTLNVRQRLLIVYGG